MNKESGFKIGQIINFDYDLPKNYFKESRIDYYFKDRRGRRSGNFEIVNICENPVLKNAELLIYMKPLDEHFKEEYPNIKEFWQHEDLLIKRIEESKYFK